MLLVSFAIFIVLMVIGTPIAFAMGLSGVIGILTCSNIDVSVLVQQICGDLNSFSLMACPFFLLAGELMSKGGLTSKIIDFCSALLGWIRGGLSIVTVGACMIFAGISGSGAADTSAVGSMVVPAMREKGYEDGFTASLLATAGALGPIIPPSMNMIIYSSITGDSVGKLFMGGYIPGFLIGIALMIMGVRYAKKKNISDKVGFNLPRLGRTFVGALGAIICPVIILGGILSGIFTATEAGIVACLYAVFCGTVIYKKLTWKNFWEAVYEACKTTGMVMMLLSTAAIYGYMFARAQVGNQLLEWLLSHNLSNISFMLIIMVFSLILGCFMDMLAVMMVIMPVLYPIVLQLGIDPIQFGVMFCIASVVGAVTPPVGSYLFISMGICDTTMTKMIRYIIPMVLITAVVMALIIIIPEVATFIPSLFFK
ncbi:MAG TPA: TRAP transporter large permease [Candidatus Scatomorpha merdigallinarum]|nr:TRAP transporter large permease [Candidatus Scatomorpha merdigallinarum]